MRSRTWQHQDSGIDDRDEPIVRSTIDEVDLTAEIKLPRERRTYTERNLSSRPEVRPELRKTAKFFTIVALPPKRDVVSVSSFFSRSSDPVVPENEVKQKPAHFDALNTAVPLTLSKNYNILNKIHCKVNLGDEEMQKLEKYSRKLNKFLLKNGQRKISKPEKKLKKCLESATKVKRVKSNLVKYVPVNYRELYTTLFSKRSQTDNPRLIKERLESMIDLRYDFNYESRPYYDARKIMNERQKKAKRPPIKLKLSIIPQNKTSDKVDPVNKSVNLSRNVGFSPPAIEESTKTKSTSSDFENVLPTKSIKFVIPRISLKSKTDDPLKKSDQGNVPSNSMTAGLNSPNNGSSGLIELAAPRDDIDLKAREREKAVRILIKQTEEYRKEKEKREAEERVQIGIEEEDERIRMEIEEEEERIRMKEKEEELKKENERKEHEERIRMEKEEEKKRIRIKEKEEARKEKAKREAEERIRMKEQEEVRKEQLIKEAEERKRQKEEDEARKKKEREEFDQKLLMKIKEDFKERELERIRMKEKEEEEAKKEKERIEEEARKKKDKEEAAERIRMKEREEAEERQRQKEKEEESRKEKERKEAEERNRIQVEEARKEKEKREEEEKMRMTEEEEARKEKERKEEVEKQRQKEKEEEEARKEKEKEEVAERIRMKNEKEKKEDEARKEKERIEAEERIRMKEVEERQRQEEEEEEEEKERIEAQNRRFERIQQLENERQAREIAEKKRIAQEEALKLQEEQEEELAKTKNSSEKSSAVLDGAQEISDHWKTFKEQYDANHKGTNQMLIEGEIDEHEDEREEPPTKKIKIVRTSQAESEPEDEDEYLDEDEPNITIVPFSDNSVFPSFEVGMNKNFHFDRQKPPKVKTDRLPKAEKEKMFERAFGFKNFTFVSAREQFRKKRESLFKSGCTLEFDENGPPKELLLEASRDKYTKSLNSIFGVDEDDEDLECVDEWSEDDNKPSSSRDLHAEIELDYTQISCHSLKKKYEYPFGATKGVYWPITIKPIKSTMRIGSLGAAHARRLLTDHSSSCVNLALYVFNLDEVLEKSVSGFLEDYMLSGDDEWSPNEWNKYEEINKDGRFTDRNSYKTISTNQTREDGVEKHTARYKKETAQEDIYLEARSQKNDRNQMNNARRELISHYVKASKYDFYSPKGRKYGGIGNREVVSLYKRWTSGGYCDLHVKDRDYALGEVMKTLTMDYDKYLFNLYGDQFSKWCFSPMLASLYFQLTKNYTESSLNSRDFAELKDRKARYNTMCTYGVPPSVSSVKQICRLTDVDKKLWTLQFHQLVAPFKEITSFQQLMDREEYARETNFAWRHVIAQCYR